MERKDYLHITKNLPNNEMSIEEEKKGGRKGERNGKKRQGKELD